MKKLIFEKRNIVLLFLFNLVIAFLAYLMYFECSFSSDGIAEFAQHGTKFYDTQISRYLSGGRFTIWAVDVILNVLNFDKLQDQWISQLFKEIVCAFIITMLTVYFNKNEKSLKKLFCVNSFFIIATINVYIEEQYFYNTMEVAVGWLLVSIAAILFLENHYIAAFFLAFLGTGVYQSYIFIFYSIAIGGMIIKCKCKPDKSFIKRFIILLSISAVVSLLIYFIPFWAVSSGMGDAVVKKADAFSLYKVLKGTYDAVIRAFFSTNGMTPPLMLVIYLLISGIILISTFKNKKASVFEITVTAIAMASMFVSTFAIEILTPGEVNPRYLLSFFFNISLFVYAIYEYTDKEKYKKIISVMSCTIAATVVVCVFLVGVDNEIENDLTLTYAQMIENKIEAYERETGITVTAINYVSAEDLPRHGTEKIREYQIMPYLGANYTCSLWWVDWGAINSVRFVSGRNYENDFITLEKYDELFESRTWEEFDVEKQIVFEGDICYWAVF